MGVSRYVAKEIMKEIGNRSREFYEFVLPPVDIYEDGTELVVIVDLPGFQKKDIHVNISKDILTLRAKRVIDMDSHTIHLPNVQAKSRRRFLSHIPSLKMTMQKQRRIMQMAF